MIPTSKSSVNENTEMVHDCGDKVHSPIELPHEAKRISIEEELDIVEDYKDEFVE